MARDWTHTHSSEEGVGGLGVGGGGAVDGFGNGMGDLNRECNWNEWNRMGGVGAGSSES